MNPFQHIENQKKVIESMKYELKYLKDKKKGAERINVLIETLNAFEEMMVKKYYTEIIETLIYSRIYSQLMVNVESDEIDIYGIVENIDKDIRYGKDVKKLEVIDFLKHKEMKVKLEKGKLENFADWSKMLNKLINEFKLDIKWTQ